MRTFDFEVSQLLPRPRAELFGFFSNAQNLECITPPWLNFHIASPEPIDMREGALIDYRLRVRGLPMRWRTLISVWEPPHRFVDEQIRGPYRLWRHEHVFETVEGGTRIHDRVRYALLGGTLVNNLFVRKDIERIFSYRAQQLTQRFQKETRKPVA